MTLRQLEQYLLTEKWRAGAKNGTDMCGRYARCAYCDRFVSYPCASAYEKYVRTPPADRVTPAWAEPEPPVKKKFGTVFVDGDAAEPLKEKEEPQKEVSVREENEPQKEPAPVKAASPAAVRRNVIKIEKTAGDVRVLSLKKKS